MRGSLRWFGFVAVAASLVAGSAAVASPAATGPLAAPAAADPASAAAIPPTSTGPVAPVSAPQAISRDRWARYVTYVYADLLGREPDANGLWNWVEALAYGVPRRQVAAAVSHSREYREGLVRSAYDRYLNRAPDPAGLKHWADALDRGWTISTIGSGFLASQEYYQRAGGTRAGWVRQLYRVVLDRGAAPSEVDHWVRVLTAGHSRADVALGFLLSAEHLTTVVDGYYVQLLGRHLDPAGRRTWVAALQAGRHDEEIIAGIVGSDEYWNRTATYPMNELALSPSAPEIEAGASQAFTVRALGRGDDLGDVTARAVVTLDGEPCPGAVCTSTVPGVHVVQATLDDMWTAVDLVVRQGPLHHVTLAPDGLTIADGASVVYAAQGFDAHGNDLGDVTSQVTLAVDGDPSACTGARCRPTAPGDHVVSVVGLGGEAALTTTPPGPPGAALWGWGYGGSRLLGGLTEDQLSPVAVGADAHWVEVSGDSWYAVGTKTDGSLWEWGFYVHCRTADGGPSRPEQVGTDSDWAGAIAGSRAAAALRQDGSLWAWGDVDFRAGVTETVCEPTEVFPERRWRSVSTFGASWAGIAQDGALWMWGSNSNGQLGDGTTTERAEPTLVDAGPWDRVVPSGFFTVGLKEDGTLWAWGDNRNGRLGDGTRTSSSVPVQVGTRSDWVDVAVTAHSTFAVDAAGVLWWWGGAGTANEAALTDVLSPVVLDSSRPWARVFGATWNRFAVAQDGTLWGWGSRNANGQIGDGTTTAALTPVPVGNGGGWLSVDLASTTTLALRDPSAAP